ncbi:MAG: DUF3883 domain-containing protein [bacterium]|nr:DUF3883 domain-containing protein [bacterium]
MNGRACRIDQVRNSYRNLSTAGEHSASELTDGEHLLVRMGLLTRTSTILRPVACPELSPHDLDDHDLLHIFAGFAGGVCDGTSALDRGVGEFIKALGAAGEETVVAACRNDLCVRGAPDLAKDVERVSLISDRFGYDVRAPSIAGSPRLLEVKTQLGHLPAAFHFHLTRNEYAVGSDEPNWSLVACAARNAELADIQIGGWCTADTLRPYLPNDGNGRWSEAIVVLPKTALRGGLPPAIIE